LTSTLADGAAKHQVGEHGDAQCIAV